jgi:hypothetical protein
MTKITVKQPQEGEIETPSAMIVKQPTQQSSVVDSEGRTIVLCAPKPLQRLRFASAMGEDSANQLWSSMVAPLMYVVSIDGNAVSVPLSKREIEALFQRLDDHGLEAISAGVREMLGLSTAEVDEVAAKK